MPSRPVLATVAELRQPITGFAPMWAFGCGVVACLVMAAPRAPATWSGAIGIKVSMIGMLVSAFALRSAGGQ